MPNWVFNSLTIEGEEEQVQKAKAQLNAPYERNSQNGRDSKVEVVKYSNPIFSFWNIIAPPLDKREEYEGIHGYADGEKQGDGAFNWYNFNNREWGTKWDVAISDENKFPDTSINDTDPTSVQYSFQTAWSPPIEALEKLSEQYPELEITLDWEEEQGFGGEYLFIDGSHSILKEWDIPNSHEDYVERDNVDGCVCSNEEDTDEWYDDCPGKRVVIEVSAIRDTVVAKN
jgi:hypothetical protein